MSTELGLDPALLPLNPLFFSFLVYNFFFLFNKHYKGFIALLQRSIYFADSGNIDTFLVPEIFDRGDRT